MDLSSLNSTQLRFFLKIEKLLFKVKLFFEGIFSAFLGPFLTQFRFFFLGKHPHWLWSLVYMTCGHTNHHRFGPMAKKGRFLFVFWPYLLLLSISSISWSLSLLNSHLWHTQPGNQGNGTAYSPMDRILALKTPFLICFWAFLASFWAFQMVISHFFCLTHISDICNL